MRNFLGTSRLNPYCRVAPLALIMTLAFAHRGDNALGQSQTPAPPYQPPTSGPGSGRPPFGQETETNQDPVSRHAWEQAAKKRNRDRQNKLVTDSSRIVQLANELSTGVEPKDKEPASAAMSRKAEEIEKLARSVRELMKSD